MHVFFSGVPLMECWHVDDTSPENTIVGLPRSWVDTDVCQLYTSINPPQPSGTRAPSRSPPVSWSSEWRTDSSVMILPVIWTCHVAKEVELSCFNDTWNSGGGPVVCVSGLSHRLLLGDWTLVTWSVRKILALPCTRHNYWSPSGFCYSMELAPFLWARGTCGFQAGSPLGH